MFPIYSTFKHSRARFKSYLLLYFVQWIVLSYKDDELNHFCFETLKVLLLSGMK